MDDQILSLEHISLSYHTMKGETPALCDLTFSVTPGEFVALVGPSGCGKSTILNLISGLLKPEAGTLLSRGRPITEADLHIGYMLQRDHLFEWRTIYSNVLLGLEISRTLTPERKEKVGEMMETYGLKSFSNARPSELSGGMRQRIIIATALACDPKLIIADEPTTALDVTVQAQILELLKKLTKEKGTSVIMITHDLGVVASMCDRIAIMYAGQIVEEGTVDEIFYEPHHPYTKGLLNSINNSAKDNDEPLVPIPGTPPDLLKLPKGCAFMSRCPYTMKICEVQASPVTTYSETHCCRCWLECMDETKITVSGEEAALEDSMAGSHFYPDFAAVLLKQKVAEQYGLKAENVLTGAGSSAMIDMIGLTFLDEGDEVLFSAPTYGAFADMAYLNDGVPVSVPVTEEQKFNLPAMKEKIGEKTKIVVICNPNNPTGTYVPIGELEAFADTLPEDVLLVMDEAYMEFATEPDCCSMVDYMKAHPEKPILVLRTFSKYYAMAGLRVGYALGSEELIGIMRKCSASWNLNVCAQKAAE